MASHSYSADSVLNDFSCFSKTQSAFEGRRLVTVDKNQREMPRALKAFLREEFPKDLEQ